MWWLLAQWQNLIRRMRLWENLNNLPVAEHGDLSSCSSMLFQSLSDRCLDFGIDLATEIRFLHWIHFSWASISCHLCNSKTVVFYSAPVKGAEKSLRKYQKLPLNSTDVGSISINSEQGPPHPLVLRHLVHGRIGPLFRSQPTPLADLPRPRAHCWRRALYQHHFGGRRKG